MNTKKTYIILALATLIPRLLVFFLAWAKGINLALASPQDAQTYLQCGYNLFNNYIFSYQTNPPFTPDSFRTPVYPVFAYIFSIGLSSLKLLSIAQYFLTVGSALLVYRISLRLFHRAKLAFATALVFALEPYFVFWSGLAMAEALFVFLLLATLYFTFDMIEIPRWRTILITGILFGLTTLTRPILQPFFLLFIPFLIYTWHHQPWRKIATSILIVCVGFFLIVFPWMVRNKINFNSWGISSVGSYNLYLYDTGIVVGKKLGLSWGDMVTILKERANITPREFVDGQLDNQSKFLAGTLYFFQKYPFDFIEARIKNTLSVLFNDGYHHIARAFDVTVPSWLRTLGKLFWLGQYVLIILYLRSSSFRKLEKKKQEFIYFLLLTIFYFAFVTGAVASARYRVPVNALIFLVSIPSALWFYKTYIRKAY